MALPGSNISFLQIQTEFGGSNPISLDEYYRGGLYVRSNSTATIPTSGEISLSNFLNASQGALIPTYAFGSIPSSISEGSSGTFNVNTTNVADGTTLYWSIATNSGDFGTTSGSFTISGNAGSFSVSPTADSSTEGIETFTVYLRTGSTSGTIQATSNSVSIGDSSQAPIPTYSLTRSVASVSEGDSFTISFSTNQAGSFGYSISSVSSADIGGASLTGTVSNGSVLTYNVTADSLTEGPETFIITLNNGQASTSVNIIDSSQAPIPPTSATWSVGYSNSGTAGPISVFVLVTLNRPATVTTTYTFTGLVVDNGVTFGVPSVTIPVGSTSANPSSFSGITNGSGPYANITLRVTPSSVPYPLTPSGAINTTFRYSA